MWRGDMLCIELPLQHPFPSWPTSRTVSSPENPDSEVTCVPHCPGLRVVQFRETDPSLKEAAVAAALSRKKDYQQWKKLGNTWVWVCLFFSTNNCSKHWDRCLLLIKMVYGRIYRCTIIHLSLNKRIIWPQKSSLTVQKPWQCLEAD